MNISIIQSITDIVRNSKSSVEDLGGTSGKPIDRRDLQELIETMSENSGILTMLTVYLGETKDATTMVDKNGDVMKRLLDKNSPAGRVLLKVVKAVGGNIDRGFNVIIRLAVEYTKIMEGIKKSFNSLFPERSLNLYNSKLSHVAALSIMREACMYTDWLVSVVVCITYEVARHRGVSELEPPKRYRLENALSRADTIIQLSRDRANMTAADIISEIAKLQKSGDTLLADRDGGANTAFMDTDAMSPRMKDTIGGQKGFVSGIFRWFGERWILYKHAKYLKAKKEKEWIEAHVALLKLEMQGVDPNSDEYQRLVKIINAYSEQIAELDQKIQKYENE